MGGWVGGWVAGSVGNKAISAFNWVEVEDEAELGKKTAELSFQNDEKKDDDKDINDEQAHDVKEEDIDDKKVIQNLPTLPHFGGECKTTELCEHCELQIA